MILDAKCLLYYYTCFIDEEIEVHRTHLGYAELTFEPRQAGAGSQAGRHSVVPLAPAPMQAMPPAH